MPHQGDKIILQRVEIRVFELELQVCERQQLQPSGEPRPASGECGTRAKTAKKATAEVKNNGKESERASFQTRSQNFNVPPIS